jgi:hypothetical protein
LLPKKNNSPASQDINAKTTIRSKIHLAISILRHFLIVLKI